MNDLIDNPYRGALLVAAVFVTLVGFIMVLAGQPEYGAMISTVQVLGVLLINVGLVCGVFWVAVSALLWQKDRANVS